MVNKLVIISIFILYFSCGKSNNRAGVESKMASDSIQVEQVIEMPDEMKVEIALKFINSYVESLKKIKHIQEIDDWITSNSLVSNSFIQEYKRINEEAYKIDPELGLGFDPILDSQDSPDDGFMLEEIETDSNFIMMKGKDWEQFKLVMKMKKENGQWLVDGSGIINIPAEKQKF
ncbi:MAG: hypothetical protein ACFCUU_07305 [Cyclobacteriaceae bacterium]